MKIRPFFTKRAGLPPPFDEGYEETIEVTECGLARRVACAIQAFIATSVVGDDMSEFFEWQYDGRRGPLEHTWLRFSVLKARASFKRRKGQIRAALRPYVDPWHVMDEIITIEGQDLYMTALREWLPITLDLLARYDSSSIWRWRMVRDYRQYLPDDLSPYESLCEPDWMAKCLNWVQLADILESENDEDLPDKFRGSNRGPTPFRDALKIFGDEPDQLLQMVDDISLYADRFREEAHNLDHLVTTFQWHKVADYISRDLQQLKYDWEGASEPPSDDGVLHLAIAACRDQYFTRLERHHYQRKEYTVDYDLTEAVQLKHRERRKRLRAVQARLAEMNTAAALPGKIAEADMRIKKEMRKGRLHRKLEPYWREFCKLAGYQLQEPKPIAYKFDLPRIRRSGPGRQDD